MAVGLMAPVALEAVGGVRVGTAEAAIKKPGRDDLVVFELAPGSATAGVFTQSAFAAAPVRLCRERLAGGAGVRALLINSGNANAATGSAGIEDARAVCAAVAAALGCAPEEVLPFSTGVIGQRLPVARMVQAVPRAVATASADGWTAAMQAIMTTDTVPKGASRRVRLSFGEVTVTGIAKGVGMIHPNMATMLAFVATDARLAAGEAQALLAEVVERTFNCVTVDGDTSTNDACVLVATGGAGGSALAPGSADHARLAEAVEAVCLALAHAIVRDGEGATKFVTIRVEGAQSRAEARRVALSVAHSPLVKTALFASDANWGRIAMAIGKAGVEGLDAATVGLTLDDVPLLAGGEPHPDYREELGAAVVARPEFTIGISLGRGEASATVWTCDFSYDYVRINAEYRT